MNPAIVFSVLSMPTPSTGSIVIAVLCHRRAELAAPILRKFQPKLHSGFDLLNDSRLNNAQTSLQFYNGNTADALSIESARLKPARLMGNFKSRAA
jgi:hypothetical protein